MKNTHKLVTPFENDPTAIVALAFKKLYPGVEYYAQYNVSIEDDDGEPAYGLTIFPKDDGIPEVLISAEAPISAAAELLAHELAHVVAGKNAEHGPEWEAVFDAIHEEYYKTVKEIALDNPERVVVTRQQIGDGTILMMPTKANIPEPGWEDWKLITCPICGSECWESDLAREVLAAEPGMRAACTACALKGDTDE